MPKSKTRRKGAVRPAKLSLVLALVICLSLKGMMKSVRRSARADIYVTEEGLNLTEQVDRYTHTTRERTYDPPQKESHSSGGSSVDSDGFGGSSGGSF